MLLSAAFETVMNRRRTNLTKAEKISYFFPALFCLLASAMNVYFLIAEAIAFPEQWHWSDATDARGLGAVLFALLGGFAFWKLSEAQRFRSVHTARSAAENYKIVLTLLTAEHWKLGRHQKDKFVEAVTRPSWFSWGERVTVKFSGTEVHISSICNPDRLPAVFGRNARNVGRVSQALTGITTESRSERGTSHRDGANHA